MFPFQFRMFLRSIFVPSDRMNESTLKRLLLRAFVGVTYPFVALHTFIFLLLDYIFFPGFRHHEVKGPLFVIGNPRSGTTFLHRVLARDEINFTTTRMWQLAFPSLTQRSILTFLGKIDDLLGQPGARLLEKLQGRVMKGADKMHKFRFEVPEEDEGYFVHPWASGFQAMVFPDTAWDYYQRMDEMPQPERDKMMNYYKSCLKRHLYADPQGRRLLSKNPLFVAKMQSVHDYFPSGKIVFVVRNPAEMLASVHSLLVAFWRAQGIVIPDGERRPGLVDWSVYCYEHAMKVLDNLPAGSFHIVRYDDLVRDPRGTVEKLYEALEIPMTPEYQKILGEEEAKAKKYRSEHSYALEKYGLSHQEVESLVPYIYDRFDFPRHHEKPQP